VFGTLNAMAALRMDRNSLFFSAQIAFWIFASLYTGFEDDSILMVTTVGMQNEKSR
jgi:hypothetical protein